MSSLQQTSNFATGEYKMKDRDGDNDYMGMNIPALLMGCMALFLILLCVAGLILWVLQYP